MNTAYQFLHFVQYAAIRNWSVQYMIGGNRISSPFFPMRTLGTYINEENKRYEISDPSKEYGILGVNNQTGIFDAYIEKGAKIKQKYKKMKDGWIAYNPYRVNVGSVGVKKSWLQNEYISPAYVVFSCKEELLPDFLYLLMKTPTFNQIIRLNTTGSVRQTLSFKNLSALSIPLPSLEEQNRLVQSYNNYIDKILGIEQTIKGTDAKAEQYIRKALELNKEYGDRENKLLRFIHFKDTMVRWDTYAIKEQYKSKWPIIRLGEVISSISTGTTPPTNHKEYFNGDIKFYTPADVSGEMYLGDAERHISQVAVDKAVARVYGKGTILFVGIGSTIGKVGIVNEEMVSSNQQITGFMVDERLMCPEYVYCFLHYNKDISTAEQSKTTLPIVNQSKISKIPIPIPPKEIQEQIVSYVSAAKAHIRELQAKAASLKAQALHDFERALFK